MSQESAAFSATLPSGRWPEPTSKRPMSLGLQLPIITPQPAGAPSRSEDFWDLVHKARLAIEVGFDMIWFPDHFIVGTPVDGEEVLGIWECWTTMAGLAAALPGVPIGAMVACTGFHSPGSIAKMAEVIDAISRGNFVLSLGCGWNKAEYDMFGIPYDHRVDRFEEAVQIITALTRTGRADLEGTYYQVRNAVNVPRGPQGGNGGPPVLIGAKQPRMMGLAARYADIWHSDWLSDPADIEPMMAMLDDACRTIGRDPASVVRASGAHFALDDSENPWNPVRGTPQVMAAVMHGFAARGLRHLLCSPDPRTSHNIERFGEVIAAFDRG